MANEIKDSLTCQICQGYLKPIYSGIIRDGKDGRKESIIYECQECNVQRLRESDCKQLSDYIGSEYRDSLKQPQSASDFHREYDQDQYERIKFIGYENIRGKDICDIGCSYGTFMDHIAGIANMIYGIEPNDQCRRQNRWASRSEIKDAWHFFDVVTSFLTIEHIDNPLEFVKKCRSILKLGGKLVISTPIKVQPLETYYRTQHRWYFNGMSLKELFKKVGFNDIYYEIITNRHGKFIYMAGVND